MKEISVKALAKVNLGLDVVRKRPDGYHEVRMIMQTIHLFDRLEITRNQSGRITMSTNLAFLPTNENTLVYKAAALLKEEFDIGDGIDVKLHKHIPVAAGMAGGSTDAAAVLYGMNRIFDLGLSKEDLMTRGVKLGADVPYCIMRGTALAEGIGEKLSALPPMVKCPVLIAKPQIGVSTKFVYENLKLDKDTVHPDIDGLIGARTHGKCAGDSYDSQLSGHCRDQGSYDGARCSPCNDERKRSNGLWPVCQRGYSRGCIRGNA